MGSIKKPQETAPIIPPRRGPVEVYPTPAEVKPYGGAEKSCAERKEMATYQATSNPEMKIVHEAPIFAMITTLEMTILKTESVEYVPVYSARFCQKVLRGGGAR